MNHLAAQLKPLPDTTLAEARAAVLQAAEDARAALPAHHPAMLADAQAWADQDARNEALARAWFHQCGGITQDEIARLVDTWPGH